MNKLPNWEHVGRRIIHLEDMPEDVFGFVYRIHNITKNKFYIGRKQIFSRRKKMLGKRELAAREDKRGSKHKFVVKESNWQDYTGSCKELNNDIKSGDEIRREILCFVNSKSLLTYYETKWQFLSDAIEVGNCYNRSILGKFYNTIFNEEV